MSVGVSPVLVRVIQGMAMPGGSGGDTTGPGGVTGMGGMGGPIMHGDMWHPTLAPTFAREAAIHLQPVPILPVLAIVMFVGYLAGVWFLRRRGNHWPLLRVLWWTIGIATILAMTATAVDGYGMELFSVHMVQHMVLTMLTPIFLSLGAPLTMLLRVLPPGRGRFNVRRLLLAALRSRTMQVITHPVMTLMVFLMVLYGIYFTPTFTYLMRTMWGHNLMLAAFVIIGMYYFWGIMGVDPSPRRYSTQLRRFNEEIVRVFEIFVTVPFHAFFGIVVIMSTGLITAYYSIPMKGWGISPLTDQRTAGGIAWGYTEIPTVVILAALVMIWQRSESRHEAVANRKADLNHDADLTAYNAYLAQISGRGRVDHGR